MFTRGPVVNVMAQVWFDSDQRLVWVIDVIVHENVHLLFLHLPVACTIQILQGSVAT